MWDEELIVFPRAVKKRWNSVKLWKQNKPKEKENINKIIQKVIKKATFTFVHLVFLFSTFCSSVLKPDLQLKKQMIYKKNTEKLVFN